jgi:hypothetical protein
MWLLVWDQQDGGKNRQISTPHDKKYRVSPVGFTSIALFFLDQTDVLKQTHIVIADNQVAETLFLLGLVCFSASFWIKSQKLDELYYFYLKS